MIASGCVAAEGPRKVQNATRQAVCVFRLGDRVRVHVIGAVTCERGLASRPTNVSTLTFTARLAHQAVGITSARMSAVFAHARARRPGVRAMGYGLSEGGLGVVLPASQGIARGVFDVPNRERGTAAPALLHRLDRKSVV